MSKKQPKKKHRTENEHFVPQLYLRGFTNPSGQMFCYDKANAKSYSTSTKAAAQEPYFYEIPPTPELHVPINSVENALGAIERAWKPMLAELIESSDTGQISARQVNTFAPFVVI